jgi:hypothetical protein
LPGLQVLPCSLQRGCYLTALLVRITGELAYLEDLLEGPQHTEEGDRKLFRRLLGLPDLRFWPR